jgi:hypothetical protein
MTKIEFQEELDSDANIGINRLVLVMPRAGQEHSH